MAAHEFWLDLGSDGEVSARHYAANEEASLRITYLMAPGAGIGHNSAFIVDFAERLSKAGLDVVTFNFAYLQRGSRRVDGAPRLEHCLRVVMDHVVTRSALGDQTLLLGGKSMGGRLFSELAARPDGLPYPTAGLLFLGYPLHSPQRPEQLRIAHLPDITIPMLFVQGTRDPFGTPTQLEPVVSVLQTPAQILKVVGGDHSFALPKKWAGAEPQLFTNTVNGIMEWVRTVILGMPPSETPAAPPSSTSPSSFGFDS